MRRDLAVSCICLLSGLASAQPLGGEFRVNSTTTGSQYAPRVAVAPGGRFMAVWRDRAGGDPSKAEIHGRLFDPTGAPIGADFQVATYTTGSFGTYPPTRPDIASDGAGNFVVVWDRSRSEFPNTAQVFARRFDMFANPLGGEFMVSSDTSTFQYEATTSADGVGNFVVAWTGADFSGEGIFASRFAYSGDPQGGIFRVNTATTGDQRSPSVAMERGSGEFMVVWRDPADGNLGGIIGQHYVGNGAPDGGAFLVNTTTTGDDSLPRVSAAEGGFAVVWYRMVTSPGNDFVFARRWGDLENGFLGPEVQVASGLGFGAPGKLGPMVAADRDGDFVVAWSRTGYGGLYPTGQLVFARRYSVTGAVIDDGFIVNTQTTNDNAYPAVAADLGSGKFVVVWQSYRSSSTKNDVFAQRFDQIAHFGDANGDGQLDVGDVFYLINFLFAGGPGPIGPPDANGDGHVDIADVFYLINFLFASGPPPL
jgi:hypothetical protein